MPGGIDRANQAPLSSRIKSNEIDSSSDFFISGRPRLFRHTIFQLSKAFDGIAGREVFQLEQTAHLDFAVLTVAGRVGKAFCPFERLLFRFHLDHRVARDQFFRFGEGAVDDAAFITGILENVF